MMGYISYYYIIQPYPRTTDTAWTTGSTDVSRGATDIRYSEWILAFLRALL